MGAASSGSSERGAAHGRSTVIARNSTASGTVSVKAPSKGESILASGRAGNAIASRKIAHEASVPNSLSSRMRRLP